MVLMIPHDSPLHNPPSIASAKQVAAFDGLRYSFNIVGLAYDRLQDDLLAISSDGPKDRLDPVRVTSAFLHAWSFVDNLYRLGQLLHDVPGLRWTPDLEVYTRAVAAFEPLRHGFQHLDDRLGQSASTDTPLLGTLYWFYTPGAFDDRGTSHSLASGVLRAGHHFVRNPLGREYEVPIGLISLLAFGHEVELSDLLRRTIPIARGLDEGLRTWAGAAPRVGADLLLSVSMTFGNPPPESPSDSSAG